MKILYWSPYVGHVGTIKAVVNSAVAMRSYGQHDVAIIKNHTEWEGFEERLASAGVRIVDFGLKKWFPGLNRTTPLRSRVYMLTVAIFGFFQLLGYLRREQPHVLITNLIAIPAIVAARMVRRPPKIVASIQGFPKFLTARGRADYPMWMRVEDALRKRLWNLVYTRADLIVCMTETTIQKLIRETTLPAERFIKINNPVVDDEIAARSAEPIDDDWFMDSGCKRVIAVGRLTKQKDFGSLIRAIEVAARDTALRLAVLGEGEERLQLETEISNRGLGECIRLYGFVNNPYPYLKRADLFVLTSRWEDPGHAILEAAALRVPIVSTDCPSGPAMLLSNGAGGDLCPVGDVDCLARKILQRLRQPDPERTQVAYQNAQQFSLRGHFDAFAPYLERWAGGAVHEG